MIYNGTPIKSLNVKHYEVSTNDATLKSSDLQAGITAYAKGQKVTGTGKAFEFANYGGLKTNLPTFIPTDINIIEISSSQYPIRLTLELDAIKNADFSTQQEVALATIDGSEYPLFVQVTPNFLKVICEKTFTLQVFYGKDNYI